MRSGALRAGIEAGPGRVLAIALWVALLAARSGAVVIDTGDGSGNTTAPPDDPGWDYVGTIGSLTGIYLGRGWVLTANHVNPQLATDFVLGGVAYPAIPGTKVVFETQLQSPPPAMAFADLIVYRIQGQPNLPDLPELRLASAPLQIGDDLILIGNGWTREADLTGWDLSQQGQTWVWTEVVPALSGELWGYKPGGPRVLRWGRNQVSDVDVEVTLGVLTTRAFDAVFDYSAVPSQLPDESVVVNGDSGGAVFFERGGQWELVGVLFARLVYAGQLDSGDKAVFGNTTEAADVFFYRDQIEAATAPTAEIPALSPAFGVVLCGALLALGAHATRGRIRQGATLRE